MIKKNESFFFLLGRFLGRVLVFLFLDRFLGRVLFFLIAFLVEFFFSLFLVFLLSILFSFIIPSSDERVISVVTGECICLRSIIYPGNLSVYLSSKRSINTHLYIHIIYILYQSGIHRLCCILSIKCLFISIDHDFSYLSIRGSVKNI